MNAVAENFFSTVRSGICEDLLFLRQLDRKTQALLFAFALLILGGHSFITKFGDDIYYADVNSGSVGFFIDRYMQWTSRFLIEIVLQPMAKLPLVLFKGINGALVIALPFLMARLVAPRAMGALLFPATCFVVMYPFYHMQSAGWIATCVNYLWPLVAVLLAVVPLRELHDNLPVRTRQYVFSFICLFFACSNELICAALLMLIPIYAGVMGKKCPRVLFAYAAIVVLSMLLIVLSPGNAYRLQIEIISWMPDFYTLSFVQKLYQGYMSLVVPLFFHTNYVFLGLNAVLCFGVFQKTTALPFRISALLPFAAPLLSAPVLMADYMLQVTNFTQYVHFFLSFVVLLSLSLSIYFLADTVREYCYVLGVLVAAFCSRGSLSLSPTVFVSGPRTAMYVYAAMTIIALWGYARLHNTLSPALLLCCDMLLLGFAVLSFVPTL